MKYDKLLIEENEFLKLEKLLDLNNKVQTETVKSHILKLQEELRSAIILPENKMPKDVVRLNSEVTITSKDGLWQKTFEPVLPGDSNVLENKISMLLPMGSAVIGYAKGDSILWELPAGLKELEVLDVKQAVKVSK